MSETTHRIAFDVDLCRPGCVLLQATFGAGVPNFEMLFPAESWLLSPTPGLRVYSVTKTQLDILSRKVREHHQQTKPTKRKR